MPTNCLKYSFLLLLTIITSSELGTAQLFKCGDVWSSKPCNGQETKVELPALSKSGNKEAYKADPPKPRQTDTADHKEIKKIIKTTCKANQKGGRDIRFQDVTLTRTLHDKQVETTITGRIKNKSKETVTGGVYVKVSPTMAESTLIEVTRKIIGGQEATFTHLISSPRLTAKHTRDVMLALIYSPASRCDIIRVAGGTAQVIDKRTSKQQQKPSLANERNFLKNVEGDLRRVAREIREKIREHRFTSKTSTSMNADKLRLAATLNRTCSKLTTSDGEGSQATVSHLKRECTTLGKEIRKIGQ